MDCEDIIFNIMLHLNDLKFFNVNHLTNKLYNNSYLWQQKTRYEKLPLYVGTPINFKEYSKIYIAYTRMNYIYQEMGKIPNGPQKMLRIKVRNQALITNSLPPKLIKKILNEYYHNDIIYKQSIILSDIIWGDDSNYIGYQSPETQQQICVSRNIIPRILFKILYYYPVKICYITGQLKGVLFNNKND